MTNVQSSNIKRIGYRKGTLSIRFNTGKLYRYFDVPVVVWKGLLAAPSKGKYFHQVIRSKFEYMEVTCKSRKPSSS